MVTFTKIYRTATEKWFVVGDCFSNDEKPVFDICQGSVLKEHDTGKKYKFDEENKLWAEVSADDPIDDLPRFEDTIFNFFSSESDDLTSADRISISKATYSYLMLAGYMGTLVAGSNFLWPDGEGNPYGDTKFLLLLFASIMDVYGDELMQSLVITFDGNEKEAVQSMLEFWSAFYQGQLTEDVSFLSTFPGSFWILGWWWYLLADNPEPETQWNYAVPKVVAEGHSGYAEYTPPDELLYTMMPLGSDRSPAEAFVYTELSMEDDHVIANYTFEGWYAGNDDYFPDEEEFMIMSEELNSLTKVDPDNYDGTFGNVLVARYSQGG